MGEGMVAEEVLETAEEGRRQAQGDMGKAEEIALEEALAAGAEPPEPLQAPVLHPMGCPPLASRVEVKGGPHAQHDGDGTGR